MADGEPVTQKQFFESMGGSERRILEAVEKVNGGVQKNSVSLGKVETKLDANDKRMDAQDIRMGGQDDKINDQKKWNRGLAAVEAALTALLVAVGIRGGD